MKYRVSLESRAFFAVALGVLVATGCNTLPPSPPVNLQEPGWSVQQGQAVWKQGRSGPELAGDLLIATRPDGKTYVSFSKPPFPFMIARKTTNTWEVEIPAQNRRYSGHGTPPRRLILVQLPGILHGQPPPPPWSFQRRDQGGFLLQNPNSGERIEGFLNP